MLTRICNVSWYRVRWPCAAAVLPCALIPRCCWHAKLILKGIKAQQINQVSMENQAEITGIESSSFALAMVHHCISMCAQGGSEQIVLEGQDWPCTYLAHEQESVISVISSISVCASLGYACMRRHAHASWRQRASWQVCRRIWLSWGMCLETKPAKKRLRQCSCIRCGLSAI